MEHQNLTNVLNEYGTKVIEVYRRKLKEHNKIASGNLYNNLTYNIIEENGELSVVLETEDYGEFINKGRLPTQNGGGSGDLKHKIEDWINVKHIIPRPNKDGSIPTIKQLAFLISRKIHQKGYTGIPLLEESVEEVYSLMSDKIDEAIEQDTIDYVTSRLDYLLGSL